jgi:hypothetical protein
VTCGLKVSRIQWLKKSRGLTARSARLTLEFSRLLKAGTRLGHDGPTVQCAMHGRGFFMRRSPPQGPLGSRGPGDPRPSLPGSVGSTPRTTPFTGRAPGCNAPGSDAGREVPTVVPDRRSWRRVRSDGVVGSPSPRAGPGRDFRARPRFEAAGGVAGRSVRLVEQGGTAKCRAVGVGPPWALIAPVPSRADGFKRGKGQPCPSTEV